mmetsp:Transcript_18159/g.38830  ORF Transcript_18159/g.38830 Transcript_18159/m.38830 type:complete len:511 (-) Transcript_18159:113-1645(-)|eukprot:CAMPEP_0206488864 /NCGR_PEP_ID=MMETSP0324_2-20121206/42725_1 /ASSEMBLY_ACC=CAM_ASM_000836 /TAXON_ID=2866 /ORGANISM="Crypthecodinium cohnii, Strain Seligo" /LENGTH=510 /DNA_ID=CAMNT_0053968087 /DNA_START=23 /DNA_END=1555 /DNA_ORIENTATION=-
MSTTPDVLAGNGPALIVTENGPTISREQLRACVASLGAEIAANGGIKGRTVAFAMANTVEYVSMFLATAKAGVVAAPLNAAYKSAEFDFYLQDTEAAMMILPPEGNPEAEKACTALKVPMFAAKADTSGYVRLCQLKDYPAPKPAGAAPTPSGAEDVALFLHTSGTTSKPKGVPLLHRNLMTSIKNIIATYELSAQDISYLVMPLFHVHGLMAGLLSALASGGCVVLPKGGKFSAQVFWNDIKTHNCTWYTAVPTMHQILLARAAEHNDHEGVKLRFIRSCSASLAAPTLERLEATFKAPVLEAYAMTEAAHQMTSNPLPKYGPRKPGSVGRGTNVKIAILSDDGKEMPVGQQGEVCIQGQNVTPGYHNRPEATKEAFAYGWFHTGDRGMLDAEGYLTLTGRIKELINRGGEKISPLEVDAALLCCSNVDEAVAFAAPDEKYGEEVYAAVVPKKGANLTVEEVLKIAKERLGDFKVPKKLFICDGLPKTATGKIQRRFVAEHFLKPAAKL